MEGPEEEKDQKEVMGVPVVKVRNINYTGGGDANQNLSKFALRGFSTAVKAMAIKEKSMR